MGNGTIYRRLSNERNGKHREQLNKDVHVRRKPNQKKKSSKPNVAKVTMSDVDAVLAIDHKWLKALSLIEEFSNEWMLQVLKKLLFKCVGIKPVILTDMFGSHRVNYVVKSKDSVRIMELIAQIQGYELQKNYSLNLTQVNQLYPILEITAGEDDSVKDEESDKKKKLVTFMLKNKKGVYSS